jgi:hypothetical protein
MTWVTGWHGDRVTGSLNNRSRSGALIGAIALAGLLVLWAPAGCRQNPVSGSTARRPADKVYTVRGRITMLPIAGKPTTDLFIMHEAIDDFVNGDKRGMSSMEMFMPRTPEVGLSEFAVGDIVECDLSVWYKPETAAVESYRITRMKKLPAGTTLTFREAAPPLAPSASGNH